MRRIQSWKLRDVLREHSDAPRRAQHCGVTRYRKTADLVLGEGAVGYWEGVMRCRARICPVCWIGRRAKAAREIAHVVCEREAETGAQSCLATITVRHQATDPVSLTRDVRKCWRLMLQRRRWRKWSATHDLEWICAEEVTRGANGWHPHLHVLLLPRIAFADPIADAGDLYEAWADLVEQKLGEKFIPSSDHGCDMRPCDVASYLTKLGLELSDANAIKGRAPLALLEDGELDLYVQLQLARTRARDLTFSRGLKAIRESMPAAELPAELLSVRGTEWGRLRALDPLSSLDIAEHSHDPESAQHALAYWLGVKPALRSTLAAAATKAEATWQAESNQVTG